jgi:hypothetical protein
VVTFDDLSHGDLQLRKKGTNEQFVDLDENLFGVFGGGFPETAFIVEIAVEKLLAFALF